MITKVTINNFKKLEKVEFNLGNTVVLIGPNNSGKTTVLQALTLWEVGIRKWAELGRKNTKSKRAGVAINRRDLLSIPVSSAKLIWFHQAVREMERRAEGLKGTSNIRIEIIVEGITKGKEWVAPLEFDYANPESMYCRPMKDPIDYSNFINIDDIVYQTEIAFLQPMSGIATKEDKLTQGSIKVRIGEGKTADVLRNVCFQLVNPDNTDLTFDAEKNWIELTTVMFQKFGSKINKPFFIPETGAIEMTYEEDGHVYDLSSSGRGFQQTLLLIAYLYSYPGRTILLDEPDAHLEVIRQRETYELINSIAQKLNSQIIIASHSEIVLNQAAATDIVVALYDNKCQALTDTSGVSQFKKLLTDIGWDKYFLARSKKHILYFEGPTDLRMLFAFSKKLNHITYNILEKANIFYTADNIPNTARNNFHGLRNVIPELKGLALFDRLDKSSYDDPYIRIIQWKKRELENYFSYPEVLERWAQNHGQSTLFNNYLVAMQESIKENTAPAYLKDKKHIWWSDCKMSEDYLPLIFNDFYKKIGIINTFNKGRFYELIEFLKSEEIDKEITEKLDEIYEIIK